MSHPNHERANKLYVQLLRSKSRTDANVLVALRGGLVVVQRSALGVTSWYFDGRRAEAAVGDQYAPGRVRSQAECRVWRRMVDLELAEKLPDRKSVV